jgi:hypothetical protein
LRIVTLEPAPEEPEVEFAFEVELAFVPAGEAVVLAGDAAFVEVAFRFEFALFVVVVFVVVVPPPHPAIKKQAKRAEA